MRTNIEIDDTLMAAALAATGAHTKREVVELALTRLVELKAQAGILELEGVGWTGDLDEMRRNA